MIQEALMAGFCSTAGTTLGKLAGSPVVMNFSYIISGILLIAMTLVNTWGCRYYLRSLDGSSNSVAPTVISSASSYILSGLIGMIIFGEATCLRWWIGITFILHGLGLVAWSQKKD